MIVQRNNPRLTVDWAGNRWNGELLHGVIEARAALRAEAMLASNTG
jgi:hypothetical protein